MSFNYDSTTLLQIIFLIVFPCEILTAEGTRYIHKLVVPYFKVQYVL